MKYKAPKIVGYTLIGVTLLASITLGGYLFSHEVPQEAQLEKERLSELEKQGVILDPAKMNANYLAVSNNKADTLLQSKIDELVSLRKKLPIQDTMATGDTYEAMFLQKFPYYLQSLEALFQHSSYILRTDYSNGNAFNYPNLSCMKNMVKLLCFDAERAGKQGDQSLALRRYKLAIHISKILNSQPDAISKLVQVALEAIIRYRILNDVKNKIFSAQFLAELGELQSQVISSSIYRKTMLLETSWVMQVLLNEDSEGIEIYDDESDAERRIQRLRRIPIVRAAQRSRVALRLLNLLKADAEGKTYTQRLKLLDSSHPPEDELLDYMSDTLLFPQSSFWLVQTKQEALRRMTSQAIAVELTFKRDNKYPLTPPLNGIYLVDPINDMPFQFNQNEKTFTIESKGLSGNNDNVKSFNKNGILYRIELKASPTATR
jgi:hypothetical protein